MASRQHCVGAASSCPLPSADCAGYIHAELLDFPPIAGRRNLAALNIAGTVFAQPLHRVLFQASASPSLRALRLTLSADLEELEEQWQALEASSLPPPPVAARARCWPTGVRRTAWHGMARSRER